MISHITYYQFSQLVNTTNKMIKLFYHYQLEYIINYVVLTMFLILLMNYKL